MALTSAQQATLKTDIQADPAFNGLPPNSDSAFLIAAAYNVLASPAFYVYRTNIPVTEVFDKIIWANLTPVDTPDGTQTWMNRALACQGKQFNIQTMLVGQSVINASKANWRAGMQDALTNVPSGVSGNTLAAGWVGLRDSLYRQASRIEKLFATGTGSTASPATMAFEGTIVYQDVSQAMGW